MLMTVMTERYQITKIGLFMSPEEEKEIRQMMEAHERVLFKFFKGKVASLVNCIASKKPQPVYFDPQCGIACITWLMPTPLSARPAACAILSERICCEYVLTRLAQVPKLKEIARDGLEIAASRKEKKRRNKGNDAGVAGAESPSTPVVSAQNVGRSALGSPLNVQDPLLPLRSADASQVQELVLESMESNV